MMNSGSITGWAVSNEYDIEYLRVSLQKIAEANTEKDGSIFLFAVGDGNHSLATAKATWEEYKKTHPFETNCKMKYALIEIVNIYDTGLTFEPIHRVLFDIDPDALIEFMGNSLGGESQFLNNFEELKYKVDNSKSDFGFVFSKNGRTQYVLMKTGENFNIRPCAELKDAVNNLCGPETWSPRLEVPDLPMPQRFFL